MGVLDRVRAALAGTIAEIEEARRAVTADLIAYRAGEKVMAARAEELAAEAAEWQRRAEQAVRAGDDELAREALVRRAWVVAELGQLKSDREEQARLAKDMLEGRRALDTKLESLELREGSVAVGLAAVETQAERDAIWDRFGEAERRITEEAIEAELSEGEIDETDLARQKASQLEKQLRAGAALEELKRRMKPEE
jgi:phage shock protein A